MTGRHRQKIGRSFGAAHDYDRHARVQRDVAQALAQRIMAQALPPCPRVLEIGCGTGFLTQALAERGLGGEWLVTDLSPAMVERCRTAMTAHAAPRLRFAALDGEYGQPDVDTRFDLICSSMAMQWFDDLERAIARMAGWLAPGGVLAFTTLAEGTFAEWRAAHAAEGLAAGTLGLPDARQLAAMHPALQIAPHGVERHVETHASARDFLRALKAIGARTAASSHQPLPAAAMRRVMRRFEADGCRATYEVVTCLYRAPA